MCNRTQTEFMLHVSEWLRHSQKALRKGQKQVSETEPEINGTIKGQYKNGAGEMALWIKYLPCEHED